MIAFLVTAAALLAPSVSIAVEPSAPKDVKDILSSSCSSVFGLQQSPTCRVESTRSSEDSVRVEVHWSVHAGALRAKIIVFSAERAREAVRELSFDRESRNEERWEAIGLVIAAMVNAELLSGEEKGAESLLRPDASSRAELISSDSSSAELSANVTGEQTPQLLLEVTTAFQVSSARSLALGGGLHLSLDVGVAIRPTLGFGFLVGSTPTEQMNLQPRLGAQIWFLEAPWGVALYGDAMLSFTRWSAERGDLSEESYSTRYGGALGGIVSLPLVSWMGLVARGGVTLLTPGVEVLVENQELGTVSPWGGEAELGFWFRF